MTTLTAHLRWWLVKTTWIMAAVTMGLGAYMHQMPRFY